MQLILRTGVKFSQLVAGDTFACGLRNAPYHVMVKDTRGLGVVLMSGEVLEISPDEACMSMWGVWLEAGAMLGKSTIAPDVHGNMVAEIRGTIGPPR